MMTEIRDKGFLGVRPAAEDEAALTAAGIEQVVTVGTAPRPLVCSVPVYSLRLGDMVKDPLLGHVLKALDAIDAALESGEGGVLIVSEDEDESEAGAAAIVMRGYWRDAP